MSKLKQSQRIGAKFTTFQNAMRVLVGCRTCNCELVGLERAMELATDEMKRALPVFALLELDMAKHSDLLPLAQHELAFGYYAVVLVSMMVAKEVGMELACPDQLERGRHAAIAMLEALTPYVGAAEKAWSNDILIGAAEGECHSVEVHAN